MKENCVMPESKISVGDMTTLVEIAESLSKVHRALEPIFGIDIGGSDDGEFCKLNRIYDLIYDLSPLTLAQEEDNLDDVLFKVLEDQNLSSEEKAKKLLMIDHGNF